MNTQIKNMVFTILLGFLMCIAIGLILYGTDIFMIHLTLFGIVLGGFFGAVIFTVFKYRQMRDKILVLIVILLIDIIALGQSFIVKIFIRDVLILAAWALSIYCYLLFLNKYNTFPLFIRSLALPLLYGIFTVIATLILSLIFNAGTELSIRALYLNGRSAAIIGLGLGLGFDLYEVLKKYIAK